MTNEKSCCESRIALKREDFQMELNGKETDLFILKNKNGVEIAVTNYGGFIVAVMVPDRQGKYADVVLGHSSIQDYLHTPEPYLGALIGRYGNRIAGGKFTLEGKEYTLAVNNGPNTLHGGLTGFNAVVWDAEQLNAQTLKLNYLSVDGEEGFPGNLSVEVVYHLNNDNALEISYQAATDKTTIINLTQHSFFNLAGNAKPTPTVCGNILTIHADYYTPMDEVSIPTGEIAPVEAKELHVVICFVQHAINIALVFSICNDFSFHRELSPRFIFIIPFQTFRFIEIRESETSCLHCVIQCLSYLKRTDEQITCRNIHFYHCSEAASILSLQLYTFSTIHTTIDLHRRIIQRCFCLCRQLISRISTCPFQTTQNMFFVLFFIKYVIRSRSERT